MSVQRQILELLKEHQRETGYGVLFICHDLAVAEALGTRVAVMYLGRVVEIMELKAGESLKKMARHPYTKALLASTLSVQDDPEEPWRIISGEPPSPVRIPEGCGFCERCVERMERCQKERPELGKVGGGHWVACFKGHESAAAENVPFHD